MTLQLVVAPRADDWRTQCRELEAQPVLKLFLPAAVELVRRFSESLLSDTELLQLAAESASEDLGDGLRVLTAACHLAASGPVEPLGELNTQTPRGIWLEKSDPLVRELRPGGGFLPELSLPSLEALAEVLCERDQILSVAGFEASELNALVGGLPAGAVARIALVGEALVFDSVWDGQEFLISFSRTL
ncbi:MAG: hypothetical protein HRU17_17550 [Polyangiaceae bacterium]|nr:hypothetical protein [Polyangiaceae bacterium]